MTNTYSVLTWCHGIARCKTLICHLHKTQLLGITLRKFGYTFPHVQFILDIYKHFIQVCLPKQRCPEWYVRRNLIMKYVANVKLNYKKEIWACKYSRKWTNKSEISQTAMNISLYRFFVFMFLVLFTYKYFLLSCILDGIRHNTLVLYRTVIHKRQGARKHIVILTATEIGKSCL